MQQGSPLFQAIAKMIASMGIGGISDNFEREIVALLINIAGLLLLSECLRLGYLSGHVSDRTNYLTVSVAKVSLDFADKEMSGPPPVEYRFIQSHLQNLKLRMKKYRKVRDFRNSGNSDKELENTGLHPFRERDLQSLWRA